MLAQGCSPFSAVEITYPGIVVGVKWASPKHSPPLASTPTPVSFHMVIDAATVHRLLLYLV